MEKRGVFQRPPLKKQKRGSFYKKRLKVCYNREGVETVKTDEKMVLTSPYFSMVPIIGGLFIDGNGKISVRPRLRVYVQQKVIGSKRKTTNKDGDKWVGKRKIAKSK